MLFYSIGIRLYGLGIFVASFFNSKAKAWVDGRKNIFQNLDHKLSGDSSKKIWFHCSSFGEFEQGRPVLQQLKKQFPEYKIVLTFFSPSGYKQGFKEPAADYVFYLPMDGAGNANKFLTLVKPSLTVFVKYDFWFYYMTTLHKNKIPFVYISSIFRSDQYFFKWYGKPFLEKLKLASYYFVQNELSQKLLAEHGIQNVSITGDTRFDRVVQLPSIEFIDEKIKAFAENSFVIIGGSTWQPDEELLMQYIQQCEKKIKLILVPHEIKEDTIQASVSRSVKKIVRYSTVNESELSAADILIIDTIGMLSKIYRFGNVAFIGGGFGKGIHNTLEAAVYGLPVLFGPDYFKFNEAKELIEDKGAWSIQNYNELKEKLDELINNSTLLNSAQQANKTFVINNAGATAKIMNGIKQLF